MLVGFFEVFDFLDFFKFFAHPFTYKGEVQFFFLLRKGAAGEIKSLVQRLTFSMKIDVFPIRKRNSFKILKGNA